jgi:hypothetical protein
MAKAGQVDIEAAVRVVQSLGVGPELTQRIAMIEAQLRGKSMPKIGTQLVAQGIDDDLLHGALAVKQLVGQINVVIHVVGILVALPFVLAEGEKIESLSLGAGNTGRRHDLETNRQVAEFKFIDWRGGAEAIRQNGLFVDIFNLVSAPGHRRRVMYVVGKEHPMRFLTGNRALSSVLSKGRAVEQRFSDTYGTQFTTVSEYWAAIADRVDIVDLRELVPAFAPSQ